MSNRLSEVFISQPCNIPRQSTESCEKVIEVLALELNYVLQMLDTAMECHIHDKHITEEELEECDFYEAWCEGHEILEELRKYWPHLKCWQDERERSGDLL
jgi:hypothetical protein